MSQGNRLIRLAVSGQLYAVAAESVSEILPIARLTRPPGLPEVSAGMLALDGRSVPVFSLARLLGLEETVVRLYTPLVLLRGPRPAALLVEEVCDVTVVKPADLIPLPEGLRDPRIRAEIRIDGTSTLLLDPDRLLASGGTS